MDRKTTLPHKTVIALKQMPETRLKQHTKGEERGGRDKYCDNKKGRGKEEMRTKERKYYNCYKERKGKDVLIGRERVLMGGEG